MKVNYYYYYYYYHYYYYYYSNTHCFNIFYMYSQVHSLLTPLQV